MQFLQQANNLMTQGHEVRPPRFHLLGRDAPHGFRKIDFFPLGLAQFAGARERIERDLECGLRAKDIRAVSAALNAFQSRRLPAHSQPNGLKNV